MPDDDQSQEALADRKACTSVRNDRDKEKYSFDDVLEKIPMEIYTLVLKCFTAPVM